jgi:release factor H-coupled RctB family protein
MNRTLPKNARLIANDQVWMEGAALDQLAHVAAMPGCRHAVGLPDLHPGRGIPIGASFAFAGVIRPSLVGGDAGCGAWVVGVPRAKAKGDALLRRVDGATAGLALPEVAPEAALRAVWAQGARGLIDLPGVPGSLGSLAARLVPDGPDGWAPSGALPAEALERAPVLARQLGTVGGGNHFLELSRVHGVSDKAEAKALGLVRGGWAVLAHSGSRGLGGIVGQRWVGQVLTEPEAQAAYLGELAGACRYAQANRLVLVWRMLTALGATSANRIGGSFDVSHNHVVASAWGGEPVWVHRKGAAPAYADTPTVVLGSRGTESHVLLGQGDAASLCSVAHGAGRRMGRSEAVAKMRHKHRRADLTRTRCGGHVLCDDTQLLFAEHPSAYKPVTPVVDSLLEAGLARPVASLLPFVTVKR